MIPYHLFAGWTCRKLDEQPTWGTEDGDSQQNRETESRNRRKKKLGEKIALLA